MIQIAHPKILFLIFLIFPAVIFVFIHFRKLSRALFSFYGENQESNIYKNLRARLFLKTFFRCLAWICAVLAFSEISWGTKNVQVQKTQSQVSFVFDISYSMTARDCPGKISRLDAVKLYVSNLAALLPQSSFSAVLAKGDGFVALPETDDIASLFSLIENLNPALVSAPGSSIGKGILTSLHSLSLNSAKLNYIWVFTDGDETDSALKSALEESSEAGVSVTLVGFGNEKESEILAGDGKTKVKTALRSEKMKKLVSEINSKPFEKQNFVRYVSADENSSAFFLINQIKTRNLSSGEDFFTSEAVPIKRHGFFVLLALIFLMISFAAEELNLPKSKNANIKSHFGKLNEHRKSTLSFLIFLAVFSSIFTSCGFKNQKQILKGSWNFYQENYKGAIADFLNASVPDENENEKDSMSHQYALFGLASTYIAVGELDSALERLGQLQIGTAAVPKELESAAYYNEGIIYARKNDFELAAAAFKRAILSSPDFLDAKINLELCSRHLEEKSAKEAEIEMQKISENKENSSKMQNEIFNIIRENESKQWKKMESSTKESDILDY